VEIPFDMDSYNEMNINLLKLHNYDDSIIKEMQKIKGLGVDGKINLKSRREI